MTLRVPLRILFLSTWLPYPRDTGSRIRVASLLQALKRGGHYLDVIAFKQPAEPEWTDYHDRCDELHIVPAHSFEPTAFKSVLGFFSPQPRSVVQTFSKPMQETVRSEYARGGWDVVIASELGTAPYAASLRGTHKVLDDVEVGIFTDRARTPDRRTQLRNEFTLFKLRRYLKRLLPSFDRWTVVSLQEKERITRMGIDPSGAAIVPNGIDVDEYGKVTVAVQPDRLVFNGALTFSANWDAMDYFLREVLPLIHSTAPAVQLFITGSLNGVPVERLPGQPNVHFTGYLDDVRPCVAASTVCVVPVRQGSGTRVKILEAMALGTPVVATAKAAEGLHVEHGQTIMLARTPAEFARHTLDLLEDTTLRGRIAANARALVRGEYDWSTIGVRWEQLVVATAAGKIERQERRAVQLDR